MQKVRFPKLLSMYACVALTLGYAAFASATTTIGTPVSDELATGLRGGACKCSSDSANCNGQVNPPCPAGTGYVCGTTACVKPGNTKLNLCAVNGACGNCFNSAKCKNN